jgi:hypothetical protein
LMEHKVISKFVPLRTATVRQFSNFGQTAMILVTVSIWVAHGPLIRPHHLLF